MGPFEAVAACLADRGTASFMLVVGAAMAHVLVEPDPVVVDPDDAEFGGEHVGVPDAGQVRSLVLEMAEQRLERPAAAAGRNPPASLSRNMCPWPQHAAIVGVADIMVDIMSVELED